MGRTLSQLQDIFQVRITTPCTRTIIEAKFDLKRALSISLEILLRPKSSTLAYRMKDYHMTKGVLLGEVAFVS